MHSMAFDNKRSFNRKLSHNPMRAIALAFLLVIIIGSLLLSLKIANNGPTTNYLNNLFTATSSVCVTGLTTVVIKQQYSVFGQLVILALIQIGGLGLMTFLAFTMITLGQKLKIGEQALMQEALNKENMRDMSSFIIKVIKYTIFFEIIGFALFAIAFVPIYGFNEGLYMALFHSISAFCNAGLDVIGNASFQIFQTNVLVNFTTMILIIAGGLGFAVWWDLSKIYKPILFQISKWKDAYIHLRVQTRIVLKMTISLLLVGFLFIFIVEFSNPLSLGRYNVFDKMMAAAFQSTTLRTAGFSTLVCANLRTATKFVMLFFMFIGGSPGGTAGGIKTTTFFIIGLMVLNQIKGSNNVVAFNKTIGAELLRKAIAVFFIGITIILGGICLLLIVEPFSLMESAFEAFSAFGTVGLSLGITSQLTSIGKVIIILLMYIGRIGSITMIAMFLKRYTSKKVEVHYPQANVLVG